MTQSARLDPDSQVLIASPGEEFRSILFLTDEDGPSVVPQPAYFGDVNLDQVIDAIVVGRDEYELRSFFHGPLLRDVDAVHYRHEVFRELENGPVRAAAGEFAEGMRKMRRYLNLARVQHYRYEKERWFLDAATAYCDAVVALRATLGAAELRSRGFRSLCAFLDGYIAAPAFAVLSGDAQRVLDGFAGVRYTVRIKGLRVVVSTYEDEADYSVEVEEAFRRFRQGSVDEHRLKIADPGSMDHVEARIVELVARLYPREFEALHTFCATHRSFAEQRIARFDREVQFYLAYVEHRERVEEPGLAFCYPQVASDSKETSADGVFDVALATKAVRDQQRVVCNDFSLHGPERIIVVTGPNQGGKTTFARAFGQIHHLAALGLPVPASKASLFLPEAIFTHFEQAEDMTTLRGKLDDELIRVHEILDRATPDSVIVVNEIFASTTLDDAILLGTEVVQRIVDLDCLAVCVTFVDELASLGPEIVSAVAAVEPDDPSMRTFRIERRSADGRAYAAALAAKYGLSYEAVRERMQR